MWEVFCRLGVQLLGIFGNDDTLLLPVGHLPMFVCGFL